MKLNFEHIILWKGTQNRIKAIKINKRLRFVHKVIALLVFCIIWWSIIQDDRSIEIYRTNSISYIVVICATLFFSYAVIASFIMGIPSCIFDKPVSPEIILVDKNLVYLGGSIGLRYTSTVWGGASYSYLLGLEDSQCIMREDILSVEIERERFIFPFFIRHKRFITIKYKNGKIITGGWLDDDEIQNIVTKINLWRSESTSQV
ncbi:MAG: hypothetical protein HZC10_06030 [Nitrospirae bacterium]|nr:hypothetical protein [Nitrospirota bacterium]